MPPVMPDELRKKINDLNAVIAFDKLKIVGDGVYLAYITDVVSGRIFTYELTELSGTVRIRLSFSGRKIRVAVRHRFSKRRRIFVVTYRPPFRLLKGVVEFSGPQTVSALAYSAREALYSSGKPTVRKSFVRMPVGKPSRPNPESVTGFVPSYHWETNDMGGSFFQVNNPDPVITFYRDYSSVRTPGYSRLGHRDRLPINPHTVHIVRKFDYGTLSSHINYAPGGGSVTKFRGYNSQLGGKEYGPPLSASHLTVQRNKAIERLRGKATGETANLSESLATINKTFDMIGSNARRIAGAFIAVKKLNFKAAGDILWANGTSKWRKGAAPSHTQGLARNWLELQYGWKPLLNDIHYAVEAIGKLVLPDATVGSVKASASHEEIASGVLEPNYVGHPPLCGSWHKVTRTTTRFGLRYRVSNPLRAFASQSGFTNPVSLAWELLPFSFVVDWFLPIGPYLESFDSWGGLELLDGWETTFTRCEIGYSRYYAGSTWPDGDVHVNEYWEQTGKMEQDEILLTRSKLSGFPSLGFPDFKNPFSTGHALNGVALLISTFGKR
jgi:hypothetical protein